MGGKTYVPPPPDYSGIAAASAASAQYAADLGKQQLDWAKQQYALDSARLDKNEATWDQVIKDNFDRQDKLDEAAAADRQRYEQKFQPLEDQLIGEAGGYTDQRNRDRAEAAAGRAAADVSQQYDIQRAAAQDRLESYGIDPSQTRAGALDIGIRTSEAAARAGAANTTRDQTRLQEEATGRALRSEALNIGRGYPGQIAQDYGLAFQSGAGSAGTAGTAVGAGLQTTQSGAQTMGTAPQWAGIGNSALTTWGNSLHQGYNDAIAYAKQKDSQSSGWGSALGLAGGMGLRLAMTPQFAGPSMLAALDEGGRVPEQIDPDVMSHGGIPVSARMSPSMGSEADDVPARLTAGEFVIPKEAVNWYGEKHFQKLIQKAAEEKSQAQAKPQMRSAIDVVGNPAEEAAMAKRYTRGADGGFIPGVIPATNEMLAKRAAVARDPYGMHAQNDIISADQTQRESALSLR